MMFRKFYDPGTALIAAAALQGVNSIASGFSERADARERAKFAEAQADANNMNVARVRRDLARDRDATLARSRAVLAAGSGDTTTGTALELLVSQEGDFAVKDARLARDAVTTDAFLRARARNERSAGDRALVDGFIGGASSFALAGYQAAKPTSVSFGDSPQQQGFRASHINRERLSYI
jgi:hypothetical protein